MSKNQNLLKEVSKYFTEDVLKNIVGKEKNLDPNSIKILSWDFGEASAKGDSYLSVVNKINVTSSFNDKLLNTKIVVKSLPSNLGRRETFRSVEFFHNEIIFYTEIATRFEDYLKSKGQPQLLCIPKCLAYHMDGENDFIALQDVSVLGFRQATRQTSLSYEECKDILESVARFHSISFAFKHEKKDEFDKMVSLLSETYYSDYHYENWYKNFMNKTLFRIWKKALAEDCPGSYLEKKFNSYQPNELFKKCSDLCSKKHAPTSVVSQGDAWAPNFLVNEIMPGKFEALLLDFQLARCASPVLDVSFFLYVCTDKSLRDKYYDKLLKDYYTTLVNSTKLLGLSISEKIYTWSTYIREVKENSVFGFTFAIEALPFTTVPPELAFDLDTIKEDKVDISDVWTLPDLVKKEDIRKLVDVVEHAIKHEYI